MPEEPGGIIPVSGHLYAVPRVVSLCLGKDDSFTITSFSITSTLYFQSLGSIIWATYTLFIVCGTAVAAVPQPLLYPLCSSHCFLHWVSCTFSTPNVSFFRLVRVSIFCMVGNKKLYLITANYLMPLLFADSIRQYLVSI